MSPTRSPMCILAAEVSGSSALLERLGDAEASRAVERCLKRMDRATVGFKGEVVATSGAGITALFDTPEDALQAACEMQLRVDDLPPVSGIKLEIRVGFHYGPAAEDGDELAGATADVASRLVRLARPGQIVASREAIAALPAALRGSAREIGTPADDSGAPGPEACEVAWQASPHASEQSAEFAAAAPASAWLRLRHGSREIVVDQDLPAVTLGRDAGNDIVIKDPRASRSHGRIERRHDRFVVVDLSSNGTFVTIDGEPEFALRRDEAVLRGSGRISFGHPFSDPEGEVVEFEVVR